jgi:Zn-dependent alcohol dehydrogenase
VAAGHRLREEDVRLRRTDGTPIGVYSAIGSFGERQVVAHQAAIPIDPSTPPELAALIGCAVTTGFGAVVNTAGVRLGESVVIIGAGGAGLSAVMGARFADAEPSSSSTGTRRSSSWRGAPGLRVCFSHQRRTPLAF